MAIKGFGHLGKQSNGQECRVFVPAEGLGPSQIAAVGLQGKLLQQQA